MHEIIHVECLDQRFAHSRYLIKVNDDDDDSDGGDHYPLYHLTFPPLKDVLWLLHAVAVQLGSPRLSDLDSFYCQVRLFLGL